MGQLRIGDKVHYISGKTFKDDSGNALSLGQKIGVVYSYVGRCNEGYVVDFGDDSFVMSSKVLKLAKATDHEVAPRRKRRDEEE